MSTANTSETPETPEIRLLSVDFDCPDPAELARFYGKALGLPVVYASDDFVLLGREGAVGLGFLRQADYRPPTWPDLPTASRPTSNWASTTWTPHRNECLPWGPPCPPSSRGPKCGVFCWIRRGTPSACRHMEYKGAP